MNNKSMVKLSNIIGIISIILLVYWVFVFISITVFEFKVFQENLTETFYLSVVAILALMCGALILNVMFNLTRIAEKHNQDNVDISKKSFKKIGIILGVSFPLIFGLLFGGDYLTAQNKEKTLIAAAKSIIENNPEKNNNFLNYSFNEEWIFETGNILQIYSKTDENFSNISIIVLDTLYKSQVFLSFGKYYGELNDKTLPKKEDFMQPTTKEEREYLHNVFLKNYDKIKFTSYDGKYELLYPYFKDGKKIVFYFSDYQRYGKFGS